MKEKENHNHTNELNGALEREIVLAKVVGGEKERVFKAWADQESLSQWFGPAGFKIETHEFNFKVGGLWRFNMIAPDGKCFTNRICFLKINAPHILEWVHGEDVELDPACFRMTITFDQQNNGKTVVTLRQLHPSQKLRDEKMSFGAVEYGYQTLEKLENWVQNEKSN